MFKLDLHNRLWWVFPLGFLGLALIGLVYLGEGEQNEYAQTRIVRYQMEVQNKTAIVQRNVEVYAYSPVPESAFLKIRKVQATVPFTAFDDESGNRILRFEIERLPPYATRVITITAEIGVAEKPQHMRLGDSARYLAGQKYVETDNMEIRTLAKRLSAGEPVGTLRNILKWESRNIRYAGYIRDDRGALYAYKHRKGDCTEYMYLFMALARLNGIPARGVGGYIAANSQKLNPETYHNWVEVYLNGRWRIIDPQNGKMLENEMNYIGFRLIDAGMLTEGSGLRNTHQFVYTRNGVNVRLN